MPTPSRQSRETTAPPASTNISPTKRVDWKIGVALAWLVLFCVVFFQFNLPNSSPRVNRMTILESLPTLLMDALDPPPPPRPERTAEPREVFAYRQQMTRYQQSGWKNLPQRFPPIAWGSFLLLAAWSLGRIAFRPLAWSESVSGAERNYLAVLTGVSLLSLLVLGGGLAGLMQRALWVSILCAVILCHLFLSWRSFSVSQSVSSLKTTWWKLLPFVPFAGCYLLAALLPEMDFDAREYHLGGPKEWYQAGSIHFLPHDVYTSFPFLAEMLILLGMIVTGDWYWGILPGKFVLMSLAPITAWGLYLAGRRWFSQVAGWVAAFLYFSTPWVYRFSSLTGVEGALTTYLFASLFALMLVAASVQLPVKKPQIATLVGLVGFFSGSAMACKYPGLISVVIPMFVGLVAVLWQAKMGCTESENQATSFPGFFTSLLVFTLGVGLAIGPWLLKNVFETGNPVYPLGYTIFGGTDWSAEMNQKWRAGHSTKAHQYTLGWFGESIKDVTMKSDWQTPLAFGLAPLALLAFPQRRRLINGLWILVGYQFLTYWLLTHRIDRFWVPLIPITILLAARGFTWSEHPAWKWSAWGILVVVSLYHLALIPTNLCGYNAYLLDYPSAAAETTQINNPDLVYLHEHLSPESKVLFVGEAQLFDYRYPYAYNTVFDFSIFEQLTAQAEPGTPAKDLPFRSVTEIRQAFAERGYTHICVNWKEILRYRLTYGYTDFVTRERLLKLQEMGILGEPLPDTGIQPFERLSSDEQTEIKGWSPGLIFQDRGATLIHTFEVFPIVPTADR